MTLHNVRGLAVKPSWDSHLSHFRLLRKIGRHHPSYHLTHTCHFFSVTDAGNRVERCFSLKHFEQSSRSHAQSGCKHSGWKFFADSTLAYQEMQILLLLQCWRSVFIYNTKHIFLSVSIRMRREPAERSPPPRRAVFPASNIFLGSA